MKEIIRRGVDQDNLYIYILNTKIKNKVRTDPE